MFGGNTEVFYLNKVRYEVLVGRAIASSVKVKAFLLYVAHAFEKLLPYLCPYPIFL